VVVWLVLERGLKMEKKDIIFALKIFIAGVLLGIFAGFLGVNPLGISQAQVIIALYSIFLGLGMLTVILTFYFIRKSHQAYQSYQRERRGRRKRTRLPCHVSFLRLWYSSLECLPN